MSNSVRNLPFSKLLNTRDLGGLPAMGGKHIKPQTFLRAASLYQLPPTDGDKLVRECKVAYDIDLRIEKELSRQPDTPLPVSTTATTSCGKT
ncbi:MAG: tyrosine-protein phosphatase [Clostridia bacterium]|nr:tyrosine-protein phosphatase [Clostridia bacterium]